jgi:hypothetical protein
MALGSTQPVTELSTRNLPGGEERSASKADNLIAICEPSVSKMWELRCLTSLWAYTAYYRDSFTFLILYTIRRNSLDGGSLSHKGATNTTNKRAQTPIP